ncbi:MAG: hypothetical protein U0N15_03680 [Bifidobacterium choerinum]
MSTTRFLIPLDAIIDLLDERHAFYVGYRAYQEARGNADNYENGLVQATLDIIDKLRNMHAPIIEAGIPNNCVDICVGDAIDLIDDERTQEEEADNA